MPVSKKMRFNEHRLMGSQPGIGVTGGLKSSGSIFRIKSYHPVGVRVSGKRIVTTHYGDKIRVFAICDVYYVDKVHVSWGLDGAEVSR
jgi:hypothetical protein